MESNRARDARDDAYAHDLTTLLQIQHTGGKAVVGSFTVRTDSTGSLVSLKEIIQVIEGSNPRGAQNRIEKLNAALKADGHVTVGADSEFQTFQGQTTR
jgi:hypothetical protein